MPRIQKTDPLRQFGDATREWFDKNFPSPTPIQTKGWPHLKANAHVLLLAPTGSGKTLAAFLAAIDTLLHDQRETCGPRILYISPLKALAYDVERNLTEPLRGIVEQAALRNEVLRPVTIDVRTGDTSAAARRRQRKTPGDILITTPESLYLLLGGNARETLRSVQTIIIDEIHAVASNKRGAHLMLSLERLDNLCGRDVQRVGLSATQKPLSRMATFLGGDRPVIIAECSEKPNLHLEITMPVVNMPRPKVDTEDSRHGEDKGMWPVILPELLQLIRANTTTLLFCNSRRLTERIAQELNELANTDLCRAHHGSVSRHQRTDIEEQLKRGALRALVATSSLELGIDMSTVDLVIQIESPGSVARGLQRIGRAGHSVGTQSRGMIVPKFRGDLLEATVVGQCMLQGVVEETLVPQNCLDVLAQHIVAMCGVRDWPLVELQGILRRCDTYKELSDGLLFAVLDMLSGHYPDDELQELRPRLTWDRQSNILSARKGSKMVAMINGGTIPDRGLYAVHLGQGGPRIGELDEEMVYEARTGDTFFLGASTWRISEITRDQVIVSPAPGETGTMPFWRGEGPGRPVALGQSLGAFCREFCEGDRDGQTAMLCDDYKLDKNAADTLLQYLRDQKERTGAVPSDRELVVERFCDQVGDIRVCILSPFGSRVHAPWAMAISAKMAEHGLVDPQILWTDDGIALHLSDTGRAPDLALLFPRADEVRELVMEQLSTSALFATHFRENAARALLLPRQRPGTRTPLWLQRLKSQRLLSVAQKYPSFPIVIETYRECLQDVFDMNALQDILQAVEGGAIRVHSTETSAPSPFARSLVYSYIAAFLYEGDTPTAERKAQSLAIDRTLLGELIGANDLRDLLEPRAIASVGRQLQCLEDDRQARDCDELHDMLRRLGAMSMTHLQARCCADPTDWVAQLTASGRVSVLPFAPGNDLRIVANEDAARYRDALGVRLPDGIPAVFLDSRTDSQECLDSLILRFAAKRGPFTAIDVAAEFALSEDTCRQRLHALTNTGALQHDAMLPDQDGLQWCHSEVLQRIKRASLEILRGQIAPVSAAQYATFLYQHHGLHDPGRGPIALRNAIEKLAGLALPWSELESRILPARVSDYRPALLDALCASGEVLWLGAGTLGTRDGRVRLVLRKHAKALLVEPAPLPQEAPPAAVHIDIELQHKGASFLLALDAQSMYTSDDIESALAYLIWHGRITNDSLAFLRTIQSRPSAAKARIKVKTLRCSGRWSSAVGVTGGADPTQILHAQSYALLDCFAVVSRDLGPIMGRSFSDIASMLRALEEQGKVRRGLFVSDFTGSQYALGGVIDRLRNCAPGRGQILAVTDPANPWGTTLKLPTAVGSRRAGATLLCWQGKPVCYLESGRKKLHCYRRDELLDHVIGELMPRLVDKRTLRITHIDGEDASKSPLAKRFCAEHFRPEQKTLVLEPSFFPKTKPDRR